MLVTKLVEFSKRVGGTVSRAHFFITDYWITNQNLALCKIVNFCWIIACRVFYKHHGLIVSPGGHYLYYSIWFILCEHETYYVFQYSGISVFEIHSKCLVGDRFNSKTELFFLQ